LWEAANAHAEATVAHEARLQAQVEAAQEVQCVKDVMARKTQKEATDLKKKLEDAEQKSKDAAADLQAVIGGKFPTLPRDDSVCCARSRC
jgi:seryl-tRNA synthetase